MSKKDCKRIKEINKTFTARSFDFLDRKGQVAKHANHQNWKNMVTHVRIGFTNGEEITITMQEFCSFKEYKFHVGGHVEH